MIISIINASIPEAETAAVTGDTLTAELSDGRAIAAPLAYYPLPVSRTPRDKKQLAADWRQTRQLTGPTWMMTSAATAGWPAGRQKKASIP